MTISQTTITAQEIAEYRKELHDYPEALKALQVIEDCNGNLDKAAAMLSEQELLQSSAWFDRIVSRSRRVICQKDFKEDLLCGLIAGAIETLATSMAIPPGLATPIVIYVVKQGINQFCEDFEDEP